MELNWENLRKFFEWASQHGSENPYVDGCDDDLLIDGNVSPGDLGGFLAGQSSAECQHEWLDVSTYDLDFRKKRERCSMCGDVRTVTRQSSLS